MPPFSSSVTNIETHKYNAPLTLTKKANKHNHNMPCYFFLKCYILRIVEVNISKRTGIVL